MKLGITNGVDENRFAPSRAVRREEIAAMLYRYAEAVGSDVSARADLSRFADASQISDWAQEALSWAVAEQIVLGHTSGKLLPGSHGTRAEVAVLVGRYANV